MNEVHYEAPVLETIDLELENDILQMSGEGSDIEFE